MFWSAATCLHVSRVMHEHVRYLCRCVSVRVWHSACSLLCNLAAPFAVDVCTGCRLLGCVAVVFVCWDVKPVFYTIWSPFTWLMGYSDPRKPTQDLLHGQHLLLTTAQTLCLPVPSTCDD